MNIPKSDRLDLFLRIINPSSTRNETIERLMIWNFKTALILLLYLPE